MFRPRSRQSTEVRGNTLVYGERQGALQEFTLLEEAMTPYSFLINKLNQDSATYRQKRDQRPMNPNKATHKARKTIDDVLRGCYEQASDVMGKPLTIRGFHTLHSILDELQARE